MVETYIILNTEKDCRFLYFIFLFFYLFIFFFFIYFFFFLRKEPVEVGWLFLLSYYYFRCFDEKIEQANKVRVCTKVEGNVISIFADLMNYRIVTVENTPA